MKGIKQNSNTVALTKGLKIAAIYLVIAGGIGLLWPLTGLGAHHQEFQAKSVAYKIGVYSRESTMNILFLISGIGLLNKKIWARKMALIILIVAAIYTANDFAWGVAGGRPSSTVKLLAYLMVALWNGLWFYLVYKAKPIEA